MGQAKYDVFINQGEASAEKAYAYVAPLALTQGASPISNGTALTTGYGSQTITHATAYALSTRLKTIVQLYEGADTSGAHFWYKHYVNATQAIVEPILTSADKYSPVNKTYLLSGSPKVKSICSIASMMTIDLTDAPDGVYRYLIIGQCQVGQATGGTNAQVWLRVGCRPGDPLDKISTVVGDSKVTNPSDRASHAYKWMASTVVNLKAGNRFDYYIQTTVPEGTTTGNAASISNPSIMAIRCTDASRIGNGTTEAAPIASTSNTWTSYKALSANLPAGDYLICATWVQYTDTANAGLAANPASGVRLVNGATVLTESSLKSAVVTDRLPAGFLGVVTLGATNSLAIQYCRVAGTSGSAFVRSGHLCAIPFGEVFESFQNTVDTTASSATYTATTTGSTTYAKTITTNGRYLLGLSFGHAGSRAYRMGTYFPTAQSIFTVRLPFLGGYDDRADGTPTALSTLTSPSSLPCTMTASFDAIIQVMEQGSADLILQRYPDAASASPGGNIIATANKHLSWVKLRDNTTLTQYGDVATLVEIESGIMARKWSVDGSDYYKQLPDVSDVSRVLVNSIDLEKVATKALLTATNVQDGSGTFYWDQVNRDVWIRFDGVTNDNPNHSSNFAIAVENLRFAVEHFDVVGLDGVMRPYEGRMINLPSVSDTLESSNGTFGISTKIGDISIAASDGYFDNLFLQRQWEGLRCLVYQGPPGERGSPLYMEDFDQVLVGYMGMPGLTKEEITFRVFDASIKLMRPMKPKAGWLDEVDAYQTTLNEPVAFKQKQDLPFIFGRQRKLQAYRTTNNFGVSDSNTFYFSANGAEIQTVPRDSLRPFSAYPTPTSDKVLTPADVNTGSGYYTLFGYCMVENDAFPKSDTAAGFNPADVPNVIYLDVNGDYDADYLDNAGIFLGKPGKIAYKILSEYGKLSDSEINMASLRLVDYEYRKRLISPNLVRGSGDLGFVFPRGTKVGEALTTLCEAAFLYWGSDRHGRIFLGVPDLDSGNIVRDGGWETAGKLLSPAFTAAGATVVLSQAASYEGAYSADVAYPDTLAYFGHSVNLPKSGQYVVTCLASMSGYTVNSVRMDVRTPNGVLSYEAAGALSYDSWSRLTWFFKVGEGEIGNVELRFYPGVTGAAQVRFDSIECYPIAAILNEGNSLIESTTCEPEVYFEVGAKFAVNLQASDRASTLFVSDNQAKQGLDSVSEAKMVITSSSTLLLTQCNANEGESAGGFAAAAVVYYGRQRHRVSLKCFGYYRAEIGDYVYTNEISRLPSTVSNYNIWRVVGVSTQGEMSNRLELVIERQMDPMSDRTIINPDVVPVGAIGLMNTAGTMLGFADIAKMVNHYVTANKMPDVASSYGSSTHTHSLAHEQIAQRHTHDVSTTGATVGAATYGPNEKYGWPAGWWNYVTGLFRFDSSHHHEATPEASTHPYFFEQNTHAHTLINPSTGSQITAQTPTANTGPSGPVIYNSDNSVITLTSDAQSNDVDRVNVRFMECKGPTLTTGIDSNLVVGFESSILPLGWQRVTSMDGQALYGSGSATVGSTTVVTTHNHNSGVIPSHRHLPWHDHPRLDAQPASLVGQTIGSSTGDQIKCRTTHNPSSYRIIQGIATPIQWYWEQLFLASYDLDLKRRSHTHKFAPEIINGPGVYSHLAAGTIAAAEMATPNVGLVWMKPNTGTNPVYLPSGTIMFWASVSEPPIGWELVETYDSLIVAGAPTGAGLSVSSTSHGHSHSISPAAHNFPHNHAGSAPMPSSGGGSYNVLATIPEWESPPDYGPTFPFTPTTPNTNPVTLSILRSYESFPNRAYSECSDGHIHPIVGQISSTEAVLGAVTLPSSTAAGAQPINKRLSLIRKK